MPMYSCPRCKTRSISLRDKHKTGMWGDIFCPTCGARLCARPYLLGPVWVAYTWDVVWFASMFYFTGNPMNFVYMVLVFLLIDAVTVHYMPLAVMTPAHKPESKR